jgi:hypothetical protein
VREIADVFVGSDIDDAITKLRDLQAEMDIRYALLEAAQRPKITRNDPLDVLLAVIDELAYFTVTIGTETQQQEFRTLVRDWSPAAAPPASSSSPPPNDPRPISSSPRCGTCLGSGWLSGAPPTHHRTSSSRKAGPPSEPASRRACESW